MSSLLKPDNCISLNTDVRNVSSTIKDKDFDKSIRPPDLSSYIGQSQVTDQLSVYIQAARKRNQALDHVLIYGPPGLGKTTLAHIVAREMHSALRQTSGPVIDKSGDMAALLTGLGDRDVLFIDEVHRLSSVVEEMVYPAMEDLQLDLMIGEGPSAQSIKIDLQPFTLVGATTRAGALTAPFRDRFGIILHLNFYNKEDLAKIVIRSAGILDIGIQEDGALEIARRSRGTPRIANRLLRRVRDYADVYGSGIITYEFASKAMDLLNIDRFGLDALDRKLINIMRNQFDGKPVGLESLAATMGEDRGTIEDIIEPYLVQEGYILRTSRGRVLSDLADNIFDN